MNKHGRVVVGKVVEFNGDMLTVDVGGGIRYLIHEQMADIVEMLCPSHLKNIKPGKYPEFFGPRTSVVGMTIQYKLDYRGKLTDISPWPVFTCRG